MERIAPFSVPEFLEPFQRSYRIQSIEKRRFEENHDLMLDQVNKTLAKK